MSSLQRYIVAALITSLVVFVVWFFGNIVSYILISLVLSLIGKPLIDLLIRIKLWRWYIPTWLASTVVILLMWGFVVIIGWVFVPVLINKITALSEYNYADLEDILSSSIGSFEQALDDKLSIDLSAGGMGIMDMMRMRLSELVSEYVSGIDKIFNKLTNILIASFSISFITFFFLREHSLFNRALVLLFPPKYEQNILHGLRSSTNLLSRYFVGILIESLIKLIIITVSLVLIGFNFDDSLLIAFISAVLNVIPYIGPLIGVAVGVVIGATSGIDAESIGGMILMMIIVFAIFQVLDNILIQPYVYSSSVKAHPLEIFIVILMAGSLAGVLGMLLAIPIYTIIRVFAKEFLSKFRFVQKLTENI